MADAVKIETTTPPPMSRNRPSTADEATVKALQAAITQLEKDGSSDVALIPGTFEDDAKAGNAVGIYRRALLHLNGNDPKRVKTRVWEAAKGQWKAGVALRKVKTEGGS